MTAAKLLLRIALGFALGLAIAPLLPFIAAAAYAGCFDESEDDL